MTIIRYGDCEDIDIQFNDGVVLTNRQYTSFKRGSILNPYHPTLSNIGYLGVGMYKVWENDKLTKEYIKWSSLINRCYNTKVQNRQSYYKGCSVDSYWHNFQNFAKWHEENWKEYMDSSWQLDKDILFKGNKIYSPETCAFIPKYINTILSKRKKERGYCPIGVVRLGKTFIASIVIKTKAKHIGSFKTPEEAFEAYKIEKEKHIKEVAEEWKDLIQFNIYQSLINYKVEITD